MEEKLALINGIGITMDEDHPVCQGIYLKNGFIEKIGTSEAIKNWPNLNRQRLSISAAKHFCPVFMIVTCI